ncbi:PH domain-containing protein [Sciscionella marina]|uniref:PH domain-containing protein n=1 Tax=Sciscionella marina TaxID=508770 RepID=UPI00036B314D|nr:PH domain-containing protein [Sciscionella marina]
MSAPQAAPEQPWRRLNPRMIVVRPMHDGITLVPVLFFYLVFGEGDRLKIILSCAAFVLLLAHGLAHWYLTTYRIDAEQVQLRTGLVSRKRLSVRTDRIRTVETTAKFGHRIFGLEAVRIGTGQQVKEHEDELKLDAITKTEAERLRLTLLDRGRKARAAPELGTESATDPTQPVPQRAEGTVLASIRWAWLRYAPLTLTGLTASAVIIGVFLRALNELQVDPASVGAVDWAVDTVRRNSIVVDVLLILAVLLVIVVVGGLIGYVVQFSNYRLTREPDKTIRVRRGLITTRSITVEEAKLRGISVREPALLRLGKGARTVLIATGMSKRDQTPLLVPPAPKRVAHDVTRDVLRTEQPPTDAKLLRHPPAALRRRLVRALAFAAVITGGLAIAAAAGGLPAWPWQLALVLVPICLWLGFDRYRSLGHALSGPYLVSRSGSAQRDTTALQRTGVIGWTVRQSFFQRRSGLVTLTATSAAGRGAYHVFDLDQGEATAFAEAATPGLLSPFLEPGASEDEPAELGSPA